MKKIFSTLVCSLLITSFSFSFSYGQNTPVERGKEKQKSGNHNGAIGDFTEAIKENNAEVQKYMKALAEYRKISVFEREEKGIEPPPVDTKYAIPYLLRGQSYSAMGKNNEALEDFNTAIDINPKLGAAYYERGKLLWTVGKKDDGCIDLGMAGSLKDSLARELFDEKFCWKEAVLNSKEAASKLRLNDFQGALDLIQKAITLCPDSASYLGIRGRAYIGLGKFEIGMKDLDKAVALNQNSVDAYLGRGMAYYQKNKYQEAFEDLSNAIKLNNKLAEAYLYRAYSCEGMQKHQSALYDYQEVQRLKPGDALAFYKSGLLRNELGDKKSACADFRRAASMGHTEAQDFANQCK